MLKTENQLDHIILPSDLKNFTTLIYVYYKKKLTTFYFY